VVVVVVVMIGGGDGALSVLSLFSLCSLSRTFAF